MGSDLIMFVPAAIRAIMGDLAARIEATAGAPVTQRIDLNPAIPKRIAAGEAYDIALTNPHYVHTLIDSGLADPATHHPFGRIPLAMGRKADATTALETDPSDIAGILLFAKSIAYTGAGTSGRLFLEAADRLGVKDAIASKSQGVAGGVPAQMAAAGDVDIAIAPLTTILATPGLVAVAVLPEAFETHIDISVFLSPSARDGAHHVLAFLMAGNLDGDLAKAGVSRLKWP